ncbi:MAG TPA: PilZ domain-containing protein [Pyrinomonadaceae bacterium]|nr:PilZ domain-containing protein [Pyrinomonadaceae bacterium]
MAELTRSLVSQLRRFVGDRRHSKRKKTRLSFTLSLVRPALSRNGSMRSNSMKGHTLDISETGLGLVVPAIILDEHHLIGENRRLRVQLELGSGMVEMQLAPIRYESLDEHKTETGYLIGAKIVEMADADRARFSEFVSSLSG